MEKKLLAIAAACLVIGGISTLAFLYYLLDTSPPRNISPVIVVMVVGPFILAVKLLTQILPTQLTITSDALPSMLVCLPSLFINAVYLGGIIFGIYFMGRRFILNRGRLEGHS
jgi:hypothetical protein